MFKKFGENAVKNFAILLITIGFLSGCASVPNGSLQIVNIESGLIITGNEILLAKAECLLEKNKIPIPSAVASVQNCPTAPPTDFGSGFAQGFCNAQNASRQAEANSIRDEAIAERKQVYDACLLLKGYQEIWVADAKIPSGAKATTIDCKTNKKGCFEDASAFCDGSDYKVFNSWSNSGGLLADLFPGPYTWYHMEIICGLPNNETPTFDFRA
jgi:hypothetical protein